MASDLLIFCFSLSLNTKRLNYSGYHDGIEIFLSENPLVGLCLELPPST